VTVTSGKRSGNTTGRKDSNYGSVEMSTFMTGKMSELVNM